MVTGLIDILYWWVIILVIGWAAWPLAWRFFRSFPDKGYILSKVLGLTLVCYLNWLLCSLHILKFSFISVVLSLLIVGGLGWVILRPEPISAFTGFFKTSRKIVMTTELVFLGAFLFFGLVRMCNPDIAQTEKMPDFAFLTGILKSGYFAPKDPWFLGETINYFYYGHYQIAMLTKLSGLAPEYTYNLGIAFLFAITLLTSMGIGYGLTKKLNYAFITGLFVAFIGNLEGITQVFKNLGDFLDGSKSFYPFNWFNWWMSSRVIVREGVDVTINEFPYWSYILGDLHAHVNVVPFSLLVLAIILEFLRTSGDGLKILGSGKDLYLRIGIGAVALGAIPAANTWDTPTYFALIVAALIFGRQFAINRESESYLGMVINPLKELLEKFSKKSKLTDDESAPTSRGWTPWLLAMSGIIIVLAGAYILYLPFHANFDPQGAKGVRLVSAAQRTMAGDFFQIYGFFFFCLISFLGVLLVPRFSGIEKRLRPIIFAGYAFAAVFLYILFDRFMITLCLLLLFLILRIPMNPKDEDSREKFFVVSIFMVMLLILLGCEFVFIKDAYGKALERQNTIFKFYYQAWIFCGIASGYAVYWIRERANRTFGNIWEPAFRLLLISTLVFPILGTSVKCAHFSSFSGGTIKATLEGTRYMSWNYKDDYEAIRYLNVNTRPDQVVLEATGPAFSHYGRISAGTGLSTILGWANHENIWRDGTWKSVNERSRDVKDMYISTDIDRVKELLNKYRVDYIYVGNLEREQYPQGKFDKFRSFTTKVLEVKDSKGVTSYLYRYDRDQD